jgi:lipoyl-dependent peroxiredoxin
MSELDIRYTAAATAEDGRDGRVSTDDQALDIVVRPPENVDYKVKSMVDVGAEPTTSLRRGGATVTNPEQLVAAGYCASFHGALGAVAVVAELDVTGSQVTAKVALCKDEDEGLQLQIELCVSVPNLDEPTVRKLATYAHRIDPYSIAMRGNINITLTVV